MLNRPSLNPVQHWALAYWLVMERRDTWADKQTELEIQTFNLFPDRWVEIYRERMLGGGSGQQTSYAPGDYGMAFGGEEEMAVTIDDLHSLDDWVEGMSDTRRMSGAMVPAQDVSAVLGYVAPGDKGRARLMTSPGGGTGLDHGDDYVAARLSIDIPTEGVQGVRELTESVERFRTAMEQATRAEADMTTYITSMGEAARKSTEYQAGLVAQLSQIVTLQGHLSGNAGGAPNYLVPGGYTQPFQGQTGGMGSVPGMRPPNPTDVAYQLQQHQQNSPREYRNMVAARGGVDTSPGMTISSGSINNLAGQIASREHAAAVQDHATGSGNQPTVHSPSGGGSHGGGGSYPFDKFRSRAEAATGFAGQVMGELGAHDGIPFLPIAQKGIDAARKYRQGRKEQSAAQSKDEEGASKAPGTDGSDESTPSGGIDKVLGGAGGAMAAVGALFGLVQSGGQMVQGWRNIASARGGDAGEGAEMSFRARMMASNPYMTTAQTRQIMQAASTEGYVDASGKPIGDQGQDALNFMQNNQEKYNMDPTQSVSLMREGAKGTKISIDELASSLDTLKNVVKNGGPLSQSLPDLVNNFSTSLSSLQAQGVSPQAAVAQAMQQAVSFNGDPLLQGTMSQTNPNTAGVMLESQYGGKGRTPMGLPPGLDPRAMQRYMGDKDKTGAAKYNSIQQLVEMAKSEPPGDTADSGPPPDGKNSVGYENSRAAFFGYMQMYFPDSPEAQDAEKSDELYGKFAFTGMTGDKMAAQDKKTLDDNSKNQRTTREFSKQGGFMGIGGKQTYGSDALLHITQAFGGGRQGINSVEVQDGKGGWTAFDPTNKKQVDDLDADKLKWRRKGDKGGGITVEDTPGSGGVPGQINSDFSTDHPGNPKGLGPKGSNGGGSSKAGDDKNKISIDLSDDAKKLLKVAQGNGINLTPTQKSANAGEGDAQVNNPSFVDDFVNSPLTFGLFK